ncbi:hypothetical protein L3Q82_004523 [Scortum barcoo]|uniref:Uncharacterized protein n=1 Tax=Scortum barcoo TaxID=214431 RepID=A0ACB8VH96_9TELE|nr:hypothetical protein L3Q82_004523 [Scortum barcoo]
MKTLERLVLAHLRPLVSSFMDPLQFAYQPDIGVDDAVIYLLHTSLTHLEKAGSTVRIMFFDFSSSFNTIQPRLLGDKLQLAGVDITSHHHLTTWILDYLTHTVLAPFLTTVCEFSAVGMGTTESTEDLFRTLRTGACGTTSRSTLVKPRSWWWISAGVDTLRLHR